MSDASPAQEPEVLEQLNNVKADAAELRNFTITFLSLLLYVNLIIASTDAEQILRVAPVNLPLLNVPLPIIGFYGFLPWLILLFHLYLLVQHYLFSQQLYRFNDKLDQAPDTLQAYVRKNLGNLPFLHWMVGQHRWMMQNVLTLITLVSLIFWPLATLLWLQMAILPYHSADLLLWQRVALSMDVLLIAWLWPKTLDRQDSSRNWWKRGFALFFGWGRVWQARRHWATLKSALAQRWPDLRAFIHLFLLSVVLLPVVLLSWLVACLPDSPEDRWLASFPEPVSTIVDVDGQGKPTRTAFALTAYLHEQHAKTGLSENEFNTLQAQGAKPCPRSEQPDKSKEAEHQHCLMVQPWLPRNLILREKVLTADPNLKPEVEAKFQAGTPKPEDFDLIRGLDLQNRNFDYADFTESALPKADLRYASLKQAVLVKSRLDHAQMQYIQAEKANLPYAMLTGANLSHALLTGANLSSAALAGADLSSAALAGADLSQADLTGAYLADAKLTGAYLSFAELTGADLSNAKLTGAKLTNADLTGADLRINNATPSQKDIKQSAQALREALGYRSEYQGTKNQAALDDRIHWFEQAATMPADFLKAGRMNPCLRNLDTEDKLLLRDLEADEIITAEDQQAFTSIWVDLVCKSTPIAKHMIRRANEFRWLTGPLLEAAKDGKKCPGLAGLSDENINKLRELASQTPAAH